MSQDTEPKWAATYDPRTAAWDVAAHSINAHEGAGVPHQHRGPRFNTSEAAFEAARALNLAGFHPEADA